MQGQGFETSSLEMNPKQPTFPYKVIAFKDPVLEKGLTTQELEELNRSDYEIDRS